MFILNKKLGNSNTNHETEEKLKILAEKYNIHPVIKNLNVIKRNGQVSLRFINDVWKKKSGVEINNNFGKNYKYSNYSKTKKMGMII